MTMPPGGLFPAQMNAGITNPTARANATSKAQRAKEAETDEHRLAQRKKQIDFGMATEGYQNYIMAKELGLEMPVKGEPRTPNIQQKCSKRSWDGQIRHWRQHLHHFDGFATQFSEEHQVIVKGRLEQCKSAQSQQNDDIEDSEGSVENNTP